MATETGTPQPQPKWQQEIEDILANEPIGGGDIDTTIQYFIRTADYFFDLFERWRGEWVDGYDYPMRFLYDGTKEEVSWMVARAGNLLGKLEAAKRTGGVSSDSIAAYAGRVDELFKCFNVLRRGVDSKQLEEETSSMGRVATSAAILARPYRNSSD